MDEIDKHILDMEWQTFEIIYRMGWMDACREILEHPDILTTKNLLTKEEFTKKSLREVREIWLKQKER